MQRLGNLAIGALLAASLAACAHAEHDVQTAKRATSPLVGSWEINADTAGKNPKPGYPQFTALRFESGGTLLAAYAANAGISAVTGGSSTTKNETDTWSVSGKTLRVIEGSRQLAYGFEVRDEQLLLTPTGTSTAVVYAKKSESTTAP